MTRLQQTVASRRLVLAATILVAILAPMTAAAPSRAVSATADNASAVKITVALRPTLRGTFSLSGAWRDAGPARARRVVAGGRIRLTEILQGESGALTVLATQTCGATVGTWKVVSGSGGYRGVTGGGSQKGRLPCGKWTRVVRPVHVGTLKLPPPPPIAPPGTYGGRTTQGHVVTFEIPADGRTVTNFRVAEVRALCDPPALAFLEPLFAKRYPVAEDGSFSISEAGYTVAGNVKSVPARGTVSFEGPAPGGAQGTCKVLTSWSATSPPPALPAVAAGLRCGPTGQGGNICFDVTTDARVANLRIDFALQCTPSSGFDITVTYGGTGAIRPELTFSVGSTPYPFEGGGSAASFAVAGAFDASGDASGSARLSLATFDFEGTRYTCRSVSTTWKAKRQG